MWDPVALTGVRGRFGCGIVPTWIQWIAAHQTPKAKSDSDQRAAASHGVDHVLGTGRLEAATGAQRSHQGRAQPLVSQQGQDDGVVHDSCGRSPDGDPSTRIPSRSQHSPRASCRSLLPGAAGDSSALRSGSGCASPVIRIERLFRIERRTSLDNVASSVWKSTSATPLRATTTTSRPRHSASRFRRSAEARRRRRIRLRVTAPPSRELIANPNLHGQSESACGSWESGVVARVATCSRRARAFRATTPLATR